MQSHAAMHKTRVFPSMDQSNLPHSRLPLPEALTNTVPEPQAHALSSHPLDITPIHTVAQRLNIHLHPFSILLFHLRNHLLSLCHILDLLGNLLNPLLHLHNCYQQLLIQHLLIRRGRVFSRDVDAMLHAEQILRAEQRVNQRAVGLVQKRRNRFSTLLGDPRRVLVWVRLALQSQELAAKWPQRDFKW